jgi:hypothetical protein
MSDELKDWLETWMHRFMGRFDTLEQFMEAMSGRYNTVDGVRILDNQDVCQLLHISKRTLQRYRASGELPHFSIYHKTYYREPDVEAFILAKFNKGENEDEDTGNPEEPDNSK